MHTFLITGLPRSRLAWMSRFLSVPKHSHCFCGLVSQAGSVEGFWHQAETFAARCGLEAVGNAELLNLPLLQALLAARPLTKVLYVERGLPNSKRAAQAAGQEIPDWLWEALTRYRLKAEEHFDVVIPYVQLDDSRTIQAAFQTLFSDSIPWNQKRFQAFRRYPITCPKHILSPQHHERLIGFLEREVEEFKL